MILIVGGTGALGSVTAEKLLAQGEAVRIMTRTPAKAQALQDLGADVIQDPMTLTRLADWIPNHVPADMIPATEQL